MLDFLHMAGGLALIVLGVRTLNSGLDALFGDRLDVWLGRIAGGPIRAAASGMGVAIVAPSSTTMSLLIISMVQTGRLTVRRGLALLMGAWVGVTSALYLVALNAQEHAPIFFLVGVALTFLHRRRAAAATGQVILSLGFIFLGLAVLHDATALWRDSADLREALALAASHPVALIIAGAVLTTLVQSSTTVLALMIALVVGGVIDIHTALPALLGANIGLALTTCIAGWSDVRTRRLGIAAASTRIAVAAGALWLMTPLLEFIGSRSLSPEWSLVLAHTTFNLVALIIWLPFTGLLESLANRILPAPAMGEEDAGPVYLETRWADEPNIAFTQTRQEIAYIARLVGRMLDAFWTALKSEDEEACDVLSDLEVQLDKHYRATKHYLTQRLRGDLNADQAVARVAQLRFLSDLESIADIIERNLAEVARKKIRRTVRFTEEGWGEIAEFQDLVKENLALAVAAFMEHDVELARKLLRHKTVIRDHEIRLRVRHFERLRDGQRQAIETTELHLEILLYLKHINHLISGVAYGVLEQHGLHDDGLRLIGQALESGSPSVRRGDVGKNPVTPAGSPS